MVGTASALEARWVRRRQWRGPDGLARLNPRTDRLRRRGDHYGKPQNPIAMTEVMAMPAETGPEEGTGIAQRKPVVIVGDGVPDRRNPYIFQPLLFQVVAALLAPAESLARSRRPDAAQKNEKPADVTGASPGNRTVEPLLRRRGFRRIAFDFVVAVIASCVTTYVSRQPFTAYGLLRIAHFAAPAVSASLLAITAVCFAVIGAGVVYFLRPANSPGEAVSKDAPPAPILTDGETPSPSVDPQFPIFGCPEAIQ